MMLWQHSSGSVMLDASTIVRPYHVLEVSMHSWMVVSGINSIPIMAPLLGQTMVS